MLKFCLNLVLTKQRTLLRKISPRSKTRSDLIETETVKLSGGKKRDSKIIKSWNGSLTQLFLVGPNYFAQFVQQIPSDNKPALDLQARCKPWHQRSKVYLMSIGMNNYMMDLCLDSVTYFGTSGTLKLTWVVHI